MGRRVLVADDSPTIQKKASGILTGEGLEVVTVSNGVAAIKKLPAVKPLLVLADISMPGKDGYEVCDFVKNSPELSHIPVLLVVSADELYDEERGARVRADGKIKKPFDPNELVSLVSKFVAQAEASAAARAPAPPPPPEPAVVTEPVDEEPQLYEKKGFDLESLPQGVAFAVPGGDEAPVASFEPPLPAPEPILEAAPTVAPEAAFQPELSPYEQAPVEVPPLEEVPLPSEPVLVEEAWPGPPMAPTPQATEQTMMFSSPSDTAEPILGDELAPSPPPTEAPLAPPEPDIPISATTLESFSLTDAAAGQVRFAPPEAEVTAEPVEKITETATGAPAVALEANLIRSVVHRVVMRMSPPALSAETIEELARKLADEVIGEISAWPTQIQ